MAAATPAVAACNSSVSAPPVTFPPDYNVPTLAGGKSVPDLRYTFAPLPAPLPAPNTEGYSPAGDAAALIVPGTPSPATAPIPGMLANGSYAANQRYVIKVPQNWNGKLIVGGTPSFRSEYANDAIWSDFALANGYAFASSNKGILYNAIAETIPKSIDTAHAYPIPFGIYATLQYTYRLGALLQQTSIKAWNDDYALLTRAAQKFLKIYFGKAPARTYAVGLSNGGAQVRSLLEQHPDIVDGGVDWSGVYWSPSLNILTYLPTFLANMPAYVASGFTDPASAANIIAAGFPADLLQAVPKDPSLWVEYYSNKSSFYADLTVFAYALMIDPTVSSQISAAGCTANANPLIAGTCNASGFGIPANRAAYVPPASAASSIATFQHTGNIGKPLVSIAGSADMFITAANNATPYLKAVNANGKGSQYWQYLVSGGTHVDTFSALGYGLQPQLPFAWAAFNQMVAIVEKGYKPAGAGTQQPVSSPNQILAA
jgi:pimeloyl-ACP methyl ester carboxylesterase